MSHPADAPLLTPLTLGSIELKNRVVMAPMTRSRSIDNVPGELVAEYYGQRAGAGLIITEGVSPSPNGLGYPRIPGLFSESQVEGWTRVTSAVHEKGGRIFAQLMHTGRVAHPDNLPDGAQVLAPSAVPLTETKMYVDALGDVVEMPEAVAMTDAQVREAIEEYVDAARNAIRAGFDGVELHGANGYLIQQFIHPHTNRRTDAWGGSIEARLRFPMEVARQVVEAIGADRVGIRLSPWGVFNEMPHYDKIDQSYRQLAAAFGELGLAYIHMVNHSSMGAPDVPDETRDMLRETFGGTFILSGGFDFDRANDELHADSGDLVAFGRPFIANPDLVERFRQGAELAEPDPDTFYTPGADGYTDYEPLTAGSDG